MTSRFRGFSHATPGLAEAQIVVTPSNTDLPAGQWPRYLRVGSGGALRVTDWDGNVIDYLNVQSPEYLPGGVRRVHIEGTSCSNIVGYL